MTQAQLADLIGTTQSVLTNYETDRRRPTVDKIPVIAKALGVSVDTLYGIDSNATAPPAQRTAANSRERQIQEVFEKLPPAKQRQVLGHAKALLKDQS